MRRFVIFSATALLLGVILAPSTAFGQSSADSANLLNGVAIKGYDPVAYFTVGAAVPGNPDITAEFGGIVYQFSSHEHRTLFLENPEQYVPAYGGWCAWAASRDSLADIDPEAFVVHDGRLFLNYSSFLNSRFQLRLEHNIEQADQNWPELAEEAAAN